MASNSVGGLYIQVKLDEADAIRQAKRIGQVIATEVSGAKQVATAAGAGSNPLAKAATQQVKQAQAVYATLPTHASTAVTNAGKAAAKTAARQSNTANSLAGAARAQTQAAAKVYSGFAHQAASALSQGFQTMGLAGVGGRFGYTMSAGIQTMSAAMRGAGAAAGGLGAAIAGIGIALIPVIISIGAYTKALKATITTSFQAAVGLETVQTSFKALLGDAGRAAAEVEALKQAAIISPYFFQDILQVDRFLLAQGIKADRLRRGLVQAMIDFGSATGLSGDRLQDLAYALGQVYQAGRLTGDEARQLNNNFAGVTDVLRNLPKYANATGLEIKKAMEAGKISSEEFFTAFLLRSSQFTDAAEERANTIQGLMDTIKDTFGLALGQGLLLSGAFDPLRDALRSIRDAVVDPTFMEPIVGAIYQLFSVLNGSDGQQAVGVLTFLARDAFPFLTRGLANFLNILATLGRVIGPYIGQSFRILIDYIKQVSQGADLLKAFGITLGVVATVIVSSVATATTIFITFISVLQLLIQIGVAVVRVFKAIGSAITLDFANAGKNLMGAWDAIFAGFQGLVDSGTAVRDVWGGAFDAIKGIAEALTNLKALPEYKPPPMADPTDPGNEDPFPGASSAAAEEIEKALNELYDLTKRWFGLRSELEQGLLGDEGFTATVQSIAAMGKRAMELVKQAGRADLADFIDSQTRALIDAARRRDEVAKLLEEAQKRLADAIAARDQLTKAVREGAIGFVNSMRLEETAVERFRRLDDVGSFVLIKTKENKSFVTSLKERMAALKAFVANIKALAARGLDKGLLESIVSAGPDAAGEIAQQLNDASDQTIGEVNDLQRELGQVANELGLFAGDEFRQAGVDIAQAQVDGLQSELGNIAAQAEAIAQAIYQPLAAIAVEAETTGSDIAGGIADGLGAGSDDIKALLDGVLADILGEQDVTVAQIGNSWAVAPENWGRGLTEGSGKLSLPFGQIMSEIWQRAVSTFDGIERRVWDFVMWFSPAVAGLRIGWGLVTDWMPGKISYVWELAKGGFTAFKAWWDMNIPGLKPAWDTLTAGLRASWESFKTSLGTGWQNVTFFFQFGLGPTLSGLWTSIMSDLRWTWDLFWIGLQNTPVGGLFDTLVGVFRGAVNTMISIWNRLDFGISFSVPWWVPGIGGQTWGVSDLFPDVSYLATGGVTTGPIFGAGEAGPEAIIPIERYEAMIRAAERNAFGGGATPSVRVFIGERELTDIVRVEMDEADRASTRRYVTGRRS